MVSTEIEGVFVSLELNSPTFSGPTCKFDVSPQTKSIYIVSVQNIPDFCVVSEKDEWYLFLIRNAQKSPAGRLLELLEKAIGKEDEEKMEQYYSLKQVIVVE